jgi:hypothetical protein
MFTLSLPDLGYHIRQHAFYWPEPEAGIPAGQRQLAGSLKELGP